MTSILDTIETEARNYLTEYAKYDQIRQNLETTEYNIIKKRHKDCQKLKAFKNQIIELEELKETKKRKNEEKEEKKKRK